MDERILVILEEHAGKLEELLALLRRLRHEGKLRYFDGGDFLCLDAVVDALGTEIDQHRVER